MSLIGCRCKHSNVFSRAVLIGREASIQYIATVTNGFLLPCIDLKELQNAGGQSGGATPVSIPNTEVKPSSADGTSWVTFWESRTLPALNSQRETPGSPTIPGVFLVLRSHQCLIQYCSSYGQIFLKFHLT